MSRPLLARGAVLAVSITLVGCGGTSSETTPAASVPPDVSTTIVTSLSPGVSTTTEPADPAGSSPPSSEEFRFRSDGFDLVGTLDLPPGDGPHNALVMVHSSGAQTRDSTPGSGLVKKRFLNAGYAVLSWDKPGSGESTGEFDNEFANTQRAVIVADAVASLREHPAITPDRIGLWGLSEAGWVMPTALTMMEDIAFMIVVSGGGEDSIEQMTFQWTERARCAGASERELALMDQHGAPALKATTYAEHRTAMEQLLSIPDLSRYVGVTIELAQEQDWVPWPRDIDAFFDPMSVVEQTTMPVLAIFGEHDIQVDPIQGADAYRAALDRAGNTQSRVVVIPGVGHTLTPAQKSGCVTGSGGYSPRYLELIDEWIEHIEALQG